MFSKCFWSALHFACWVSSARQFSLKFHVILKYICQVHNDILAFPLSSTDVETRSGEMVITLAPEIIVMGLFFTTRSCKHCQVEGIWWKNPQYCNDNRLLQHFTRISMIACKMGSTTLHSSVLLLIWWRSQENPGESRWSNDEMGRLRTPQLAQVVPVA